MGSKVAARRVQAAESSTTSCEIPSAAEAVITIARRKRPQVDHSAPVTKISTPEDTYIPEESRNKTSASAYNASPTRYNGRYVNFEDRRENYSQDYYEGCVQPVTAPNSFFGGRGGHFLQNRYEDSYANTTQISIQGSDRLSRHNSFRKRRRYQEGAGPIFGDYSGGGMTRTEQLLQFGMPMPHYSHALSTVYPYPTHKEVAPPHSQQFFAPPQPITGFSEYPISSNMGRTNALLASEASRSDSKFGIFTDPIERRGGIVNRDADNRVSDIVTTKQQPAPAPAVKPEPKKLDPKDLFALLSANGLV